MDLGELIERMVDALPELRKKWPRPSGQRSSGEAYNDLDEAVLAVNGRLTSGNLGGLEEMWEVVEDALREGDEDTKTAIRVGFLEDVAEADWDLDVDVSLLEPGMGPLTADEWKRQRARSIRLRPAWKNFQRIV